MKRLFIVGSCVLLTACQWFGATENTPPSQNEDDYALTLEYQLEVRNNAHEDDLLAAAKRTLERRLEHLGMEHSAVTLDESGTPTLRVGVNSASGAIALTERLTNPFNIRFMKEVSVEEANATPGGLVVAEKQGFIDTGLTEEHVDWLTEVTIEQKSQVTIALTAAGRQLKQRVFTELSGKNIGLFVRNQPVYKLTVDPKDVATPDIIILIPDPVLGPVFVDDMNVSQYVTFVPQN